ncbi:MAG: AAA family ATPase [Gemmatimonadaceae bacterium]
MIHLRSLSLKSAVSDSEVVFPFSVPAIRSLESLDVAAPITFFVGENGSGKSTLLEGLALAANLPAVGSAGLELDESLNAQRALAKRLRLSWDHRTRRGFFLRAEDFFGFTKMLGKLRVEMQQRLRDVDAEYVDRSDYARGLASGPARASLAEMQRRYGVDLDANSHGQSFLKLFQSRFVPGGLYLLDEPEAPLSPQSQLGLLAMLKDMLAQDAQFIIATHSPLLLAYPGARIVSFDVTPVGAVTYAELEHVNLTRDFLANPERFLRHL